MYIWFLQESCGGTCGSLTCRCLQGNLAKIVFCVLASLGWVLAILLYLVCPSMNLVRGTKLWGYVLVFTYMDYDFLYSQVSIVMIFYMVIRSEAFK